MRKGLKAKLEQQQGAESENKILRKVVEQQQRQLESFARKRPKQRALSIPKGGYARIAIPDTHGSKCDHEAVAAFLSDLEHISNIREVILLGDHLDCGGFLAEHFPLSYLNEMHYSFADDVAAANQFLDDVQARCPKARITYLEGNHEARIESWIVKQVHRSQKDAAMLRKIFGPEILMSLEKRGIEFVPRESVNDGLTARGVIKRGKCLFTHGIRVGKNAAKATLQDYKKNVVFGHVHSIQSFTESSAEEAQIGAWSPGCLSLLRPLWRHTPPTHWGHGYGLQILDKDGGFLHLNVRIIDGVSLLRHLFS